MIFLNGTYFLIYNSNTESFTNSHYHLILQDKQRFFDSVSKCPSSDFFEYVSIIVYNIASFSDCIIWARKL